MNAKAIIKELRKRVGLSQDNFAERYGIPAPTIRNWEQGNSEPPAYVIALLTEAVAQEHTAHYTWVFEEYRDVAGMGTSHLFKTQEEAEKTAQGYWANLSEADQNTYTNDEAGRFWVALYKAEYDSINGVYYYEGDPVVISWNALE